MCCPRLFFETEQGVARLRQEVGPRGRGALGSGASVSLEFVGRRRMRHRYSAPRRPGPADTTASLRLWRIGIGRGERSIKSRHVDLDEDMKLSLIHISEPTRPEPI
eukprot:1962463-Pyramimonas_sp.AAC.2